MTRSLHYLDHNASAPLLPEAREAMMAALDLTGNPSSVHRFGRSLRNLLDIARAEVAGLAGAERDQVVFTGSATEALNQAIIGAAKALGIDGIIISAAEHLAVVKAAQESGLPVEKVGLDPAGRIELDKLTHHIDNTGDRRLLVVVHAVNNETGVVQPLAEIERIVGPTPHFLLVDAVQAFGKVDLEFGARAADMMVVSGHKIGGPRGVGALLLKPHCNGVRIIAGGGQEQGRRGGTEPVDLIAGFGAAAARQRSIGFETIRDLTADLEGRLRALCSDIVIFGGEAERIGNTVSFAVPGIKNAVAMMALDLEGVMVSSGSACSSGKVGRSHVLEAMGVTPELAESALRVSLGWSSTARDVDAFIDAFAGILDRRREGQAA